MKDFDNKLNDFFKTLEDRVTQYVPNMIAETATEHFKDAFTKKSWDNVAWKGYGNAEREPKRGSLMMRTDALFNSIRPTLVTPQKVTINAGNSKVPYARIHNEGLLINKTVSVKQFSRRRFQLDEISAPGARKAKYVKTSVSTGMVKTHSRKMNLQMPKRQFMGKSNLLFDEIKTRFKNNFKTI